MQIKLHIISNAQYLKLQKSNYDTFSIFANTLPAHLEIKLVIGMLARVC